MKFLTVTDTFGPALHSAISEGQDKLTKVQDRNAALVQANVTKGIRSQKYKSSWPELSETTKERKEEKGKSPLTLIEEGELSSSFEIVKENDSTVVVGTNSKYARIHEFGFEAKNIPARPYFRPALEDSKKLILKNFRDALKDIFKK
ncbi:phage virion morphogenesis family protein [Leptospira kirschneri str. 200801925]|uniref:Phage virion morphogenesis family protein n=2 Tax=Leptospira TaxID=171 RepID=M6ZI12_LEPIR|nr:phage virion morphogenesis protein [Leptospira kirschneri]EKO53338.1 phage virion morphogenesis family protein [Leptospira kirschneri str. 200802841]EMO76185.1 phage virion morphogenesis family protein [Leptospira kirschneri str. 200801925]EMO80504.1 phage virion morphogenesis family protein [Leptospira kirschneri str. 200801774]EMP05726.1 phage virion morphogenesis family protein [Leptospira interrogans serovar Pyrogenes str. 200701872]